MKRPAKKIFSIRLDADLVAAIRDLGFTLTEAVEAALRDWIERQKDRKR
jgi:uncharacterized protein (DUF4415 family)